MVAILSFSFRGASGKRYRYALISGVKAAALRLRRNLAALDWRAEGETLSDDTWRLLHAHNRRGNGSVRRDRLAHRRSGGRQTLEIRSDRVSVCLCQVGIGAPRHGGRKFTPVGSEPFLDRIGNVLDRPRSKPSFIVRREVWRPECAKSVHLVTNRRTSQRMPQVWFANERSIGVACLAVHDGNEIPTAIDVARRGKRSLHASSGERRRSDQADYCRPDKNGMLADGIGNQENLLGW